MNRFRKRIQTFTGICATVATIVVGYAFIQLGNWQLARAAEKKDIVARQIDATAQPALTGITAGEIPTYRRVRVEGRYDQSRQFLLDNRTVGGQAGFELITPFYLNEENYILVNRGWLGHNGDRRVSLPELPIIAERITLEGIITTPSRGFTLGSAVADIESRQWPVILQFIDYETIAAKLAKMPVSNMVVIATSNTPGSYEYNWKPVASGAEKHLGYAFQWFAMLAALIILYLYLMVFKKHNE